MLRHVAVFTWKPDTSDDSIRALSEGLAGLPAKIPEIRSYSFGPDAHLGGTNDDFAVVADFDDAAGFRRYVEHPAHRLVIAELLTPILAARHAVQYDV